MGEMGTDVWAEKVHSGFLAFLGAALHQPPVALSYNCGTVISQQSTKAVVVIFYGAGTVSLQPL